MDEPLDAHPLPAGGNLPAADEGPGRQPCPALASLEAIPQATNRTSPQAHATGGPTRADLERERACEPAATSLPGLMLDLIEARPLGGGRKRSCDLCLGVVALVLAVPILVLAVTALKFLSPGPVLFAHTRIGFRGRPFRCWKLRTMVPDGEAVLREHLARDPVAAREWRETQKLVADPRVTPLGRLLRRASVDELPQLLNVVRGEMSLIGPRPVTEPELARYGEHAGHYLSARPGLSGAWQVGRLTCTDYAQRVSLDVQYVRNWSMMTDLRIALRTVAIVLRQEGSV